jgi:hypothetical protein
MQALVTKLIPLIIAVGMVIDVWSCFLFMRRNRKGYGASGIPMVPLVACYLLPLIISERSVFTSLFLVDCLLLFGFHVLVVFLIPIWDRKWLIRKKYD